MIRSYPFRFNINLFWPYFIFYILCFRLVSEKNKGFGYIWPLTTIYIYLSLLKFNYIEFLFKVINIHIRSKWVLH